jgi:hypothetical protein
VNWIDLDEKTDEKRAVASLFPHRKTYELPEDGQELRPKHVGAIINRSKHLKQVGVKYYVCNIVERKKYNMKKGIEP